MATIELHGLAVERGGARLLHDVDLRIEDGEVMGLLGRSGSGKTTLLRAVAGLEPVAAGRVLLDGRDVTGVRSRDRGLGMVHQGAPLQPQRDVEGNLMLPLEFRGDDRDTARERAVGEALRFGLSRLLGRRPRQLSTGERAAAATARSVMRRPDGLLLDEPATHLDHQTRARVLQQVRIVQRTQGTTVLVASNDIGVISAIAHRVAVLDRRTVAQVAPLPDLVAAPVTLDVADLVHPAPLSRLPGSVAPGGRGRRTRVHTAAGTLPTWDTRVRDHTGDVLLGLAQHDLALVAPGTGDLTGRVGRVATTGARQLVTVTTAAGDLVVAVGGRDEVPDPGAAVGVRVARALVATSAGDVLTVVDRP